MKKVKHNYLEESNFISDRNFDIYYKNQTFDLSNISYTEFNGCLFENCTFIEEGKNISFYHCKFNNCNLCNIVFSKTKFYICEINDSKLIGSRFDESIFESIEINESNFKLSFFIYHKFKEVEINKSVLIESLFDSCVINKIKLKDNDLSKIDITNTKFNIDLSSNIIEGINITIEDIKGATISYDQTTDLIRLLQVEVK